MKATDKTFYGQELDCPDKYIMDWHSCPDCEQAMYYCECDDDKAEELRQLYAELTD